MPHESGIHTKHLSFSCRRMANFPVLAQDTPMQAENSTYKQYLWLSVCALSPPTQPV